MKELKKITISEELKNFAIRQEFQKEISSLRKQVSLLTSNVKELRRKQNMTFLEKVKGTIKRLLRQRLWH